MKKEKYCVYRYKDCEGNIIYVGKTKCLDKRIKQHKKDEWNGETHLIEYIELSNDADMCCHEIYYINTHNPKYNIKDKKDGTPTMTPSPNIEWKVAYEKKKPSYTAEIGEEVKKLESIYSDLNAEVFGGKLPDAIIKLFYQRQEKASIVYEKERNFLYEIFVNHNELITNREDEIKRFMTQVIYAYGDFNEIKVHSQQSRYRNAKFAKVCSDYGICVEDEYDKNGKKHGVCISDVGTVVVDIFNRYDFNKFGIYKKMKTSGASNNSSYIKYDCSRSGQGVYACKKHNLICLDGLSKEEINDILNRCSDYKLCLMEERIECK